MDAEALNTQEELISYNFYKLFLNRHLHISKDARQGEFGLMSARGVESTLLYRAGFRKKFAPLRFAERHPVPGRRVPTKKKASSSGNTLKAPAATMRRKPKSAQLGVSRA